MPVAGAHPGVDLRAVHGAVHSSGSQRSARAIRSTPDDAIGAQVSTAQLEKIESYVKIGLDEGAELLIGGERSHLGGELEGGYYFQPTVFKGDNEHADLPGGDLRPSARRDDLPRTRRRRSRSRTTRCTASAPVFGRGTRVGPTGWAAAIKAGRVWTNCYHLYPARRGVRRLQGLGRRSRDPQDDARPLHADQVPACELRPQAPGVLLGGKTDAGRDDHGHRRGARRARSPDANVTAR